MGFKFTLLGIEFSNPARDEGQKIPKRTTKLSQKEKFKRAVEKCHSKTKKSESFGDCMSRELKKKK